MAMAVAGTSRPCSGACHEISHAIDELHPGRATHGQQVGVGT
jgi:glycerol-1-phosphate dehydrogenase [NAD(P)+]